MGICSETGSHSYPICERVAGGDGGNETLGLHCKNKTAFFGVFVGEVNKSVLHSRTTFTLYCAWMRQEDLQIRICSTLKSRTVLDSPLGR